MSAWEIRACILFNRANRRRSWRWLFGWVSRLGDGIFWYLLGLSLPLAYGRSGLETTLRMSAVGLAGVLLYRGLKSATGRERPCARSARILTTVPPLDRYSFPSGHTLHAVAFTMVVVAYHPELAALVLPFTFLVALSRLILGLHYPSDVVVGALLGALIGLGVLSLTG